MGKIDLSQINTENRNPDTLEIDTLDSLGIVTKINNEDKKVALAVEAELPNIASAVELIVKALNNNGRLIYIGAGTSGRLGILDASECPPTYGVNIDLVQGLIAGGKRAILESVENAEDNKELGQSDLKSINFNKNDVLVGIAASGRTPYVIGAVEYAKSLGGATIALCCSKNSSIGNLCDIKIEVLVSAEVITGSTRMKAGTAQKMVLNMLSSAAMIKLGKVYSNLMVDVQPLNLKLMERCKSIFIVATNSTYEEAEQFLKNSNFNLKTAILMKLATIPFSRAEELLNTTCGNLRKALELSRK